MLRTCVAKSRPTPKITDERLAEIVEEGERGYDIDAALKRRGASRPPIGSAAATVESVRLDPELKRGLLLSASSQHVSMSELIRQVLR